MKPLRVMYSQQRRCSSVEDNILKARHLNHHKPALRSLEELLMARVESFKWSFRKRAPRATGKGASCTTLYQLQKVLSQKSWLRNAVIL